MVAVDARLTDWWSLSPLGVLFHATRSSSEYCGHWTYDDSDPLTLPTIRSLALLKTCQLIIGNQPFVIKISSFIGLIWTQSLSSLTGADLSILLYLGLWISQQSIIYHQDNMTLEWSWTIHHVHNQPKLCWITLPKPVLTLFWLIGDRLRVFTPGFWNLGSKTYIS